MNNEFAISAFRDIVKAFRALADKYNIDPNDKDSQLLAAAMCDLADELDDK